ncbi:hypothetical protein RHMOL_Rhmol10G0250200 [Rhododendron molle]|uniref:Uncharacterized protein n=1 Tax=Rhododendron molle TaxID=49168 RepID=A0ACC0M633_RHOML|nr:hypothetical protein RHMOL_Rhmol10G0250200 [Rhododendron molle]
METDPKLEAAILYPSQCYLGPLEELPILTKEELLTQEREYFEKAETISERNHMKWDVLRKRLWDMGSHDDLVEVLHLTLAFTVETLSKAYNKANCSTAEATSTPSS